MKKLEHFNFLLVQSQQQQLRNFNPSKSFYLQMIPNAIACYQNLLLTQRSIGQRNVQVGALRSRLAPDFSSFYYFTPEFFEEGRRKEHPPSSLKISRTPTTKPCPYTMPPHARTNCSRLQNISTNTRPASEAYERGRNTLWVPKGFGQGRSLL